MDADEVSEHDQLATLSYLVACLLPHLGGSARRAARARERVESRVTSSGTRGLTHRWSSPLEPGGYVSGWRVHLCNIHGRNGLHGLNSRRGHQLHFGIVRLRYCFSTRVYTCFLAKVVFFLANFTSFSLFFVSSSPAAGAALRFTACTATWVEVYTFPQNKTTRNRVEYSIVYCICSLYGKTVYFEL